jgi:hypothetical protein
MDSSNKAQQATQSEFASSKASSKKTSIKKVLK